MSNIPADDDENTNETDAENTKAETDETRAERLDVPDRAAMLQRNPVIRPR